MLGVLTLPDHRCKTLEGFMIVKVILFYCSVVVSELLQLLCWRLPFAPVLKVL